MSGHAHQWVYHVTITGELHSAYGRCVICGAFENMNAKFKVTRTPDEVILACNVEEDFI